MWNRKSKIMFILYKLTASWLPESRHSKLARKMRCFYAKQILNQMGESVNIERGARFTPGIKVGSHSGIGINCEVYGDVTIGRDGMMGPEVIIYTQNHIHKLGTKFGNQGYEKSPVSIGDNVWIGRRAMFMPGSSVGNNVVVAAGAVVTGNFPSNVIVGGGYLLR